MMPEEKQRLLALLDQQPRWCRDAEAHDSNGSAVQYDDEAAVAWGITGALCRLFGWQRACALFEQFDRHISGKRVGIGWPPCDTEMDAMRTLQEFNDRAGMTFSSLRKRIETMPVWHGKPRRSGPAFRNDYVHTM